MKSNVPQPLIKKESSRWKATFSSSTKTIVNFAGWVLDSFGKSAKIQPLDENFSNEWHYSNPGASIYPLDQLIKDVEDFSNRNAAYSPTEPSIFEEIPANTI
ncbi:MAG: hypothetical protein KA998_00905 [Rickettsiaceae bacterium]|nr:hypothetical protein [Rickettsiaceae bacterium]